jgi:two-component system, OmpR family, phosphate regulon sensor histidine kinase PhoR
MASLFRRHSGDRHGALRLEAERGRRLVEASPELVLVLDEDERVIAASGSARRELGAEEGARLADLVAGSPALRVPYEVNGRQETLVYVTGPGGAPYEELRTAFTAAVSHELRTPVARLLALLETAQLPGADVGSLVEQARQQVDGIRELVDDVLFLSELETGREVVALMASRARPVLDDVVARLDERAHRADVELRVEGDADIELPLRPRMLRVVAENLAANAIRYAGLGATCTLAVERTDRGAVLRVSDDGVGVDEEDLPRLFERFFRADRVRASRGTGLGLAIVKHIVTSAGGTVEALGGPGRGLEIRCSFPPA